MGWTVAQTGARERYAVPRGLARYETMDRLYTDAWCRLPRDLVRRLPRGMDRYANRYVANLAPVKSFELQLAAGALRERINVTKSPDVQLLRWIGHGTRFSKLVRSDLTTRRLDRRSDAFFVHSVGALESATYVRERGLPVIIEQLDPFYSDVREVAAERRRWPNWEGPPPTLHEPLCRRIRAEWDVASAVVVHSEWSRRSAIKLGCPADRLVTIPHPYDPPPGRMLSSPRVGGVTISRRRLHVLWLGQVVLRKGIPYLLEAARQLPEVRFSVAGRIGVDGRVLRGAAPPNVTIFGPVSAGDAARLWTSADLFVLPTVSDGFAVTQLEAMAAGLPVIATGHCGEVVSDGVDGYVVPVRDAAALAAAVKRLDDDRELLHEFSTNALVKASQFGIKNYVAKVGELIHRVDPESLLGRRTDS